MDVTTMTMPDQELREQLEAYREAIHRAVDEEFEAVLDGLEAMDDGHPVIDIREAFTDGGLDDVGRPNFALARADRDQAMYMPPGRPTRWGPRSNRAGRSQFGFDARAPNSTYPREDTTLVQVFSRPGEWEDQMNEEPWFTLVPMVPPEARRAAGGKSKLREHFILWEVDEWHRRRQEQTPDRDPLLLEPIGGDLFTVKAAWELTDLERAVMRGRLRDEDG